MGRISGDADEEEGTRDDCQAAAEKGPRADTAPRPVSEFPARLDSEFPARLASEGPRTEASGAAEEEEGW